MSATSPAMKRLLQAGAAAAGIYGGLIGVATEVRKPTSVQDAEHQAAGTTFGWHFVRDAAIGAADDVVAIAALRTPWARKNIGKRTAGLVQNAFLLGGTATAGAVLGHDYMQWQGARQYLADHNDLSLSQHMVPDPRMGAIDGFKSGSLASLQRTQMTGIASPAAGGIFYRMLHNPFADSVREPITPKDQRQAHDPRLRAMAYGLVGGHVGMLLGMRRGLARASLLGLTMGVAAGMYGIASARNPNMALNAQAAGDLALSVAPTTIVASSLFGLSSLKGRGAGIARVVNAGLERAVKGSGRLGAHLGIASARIDHAMTSIQRVQPAWMDSLATTLNTQSYGAGAFLQGMGVDNGFSRALMSPNTRSAMTGALETTAQTTSAVNKFVLGNVSQMFLATEKHSTTRWEKSLGIGHLMVVAPHQAVLAATAIGIADDRKKSKATTTMPSNRRRA